jgi:hypothetical protein
MAENVNVENYEEVGGEQRKVGVPYINEREVQGIYY